MGVLQWTYSEGEEKQRGQVISEIVQSGIKLFLHQRNQIPLPLEHLGRQIPRPPQPQQGQHQQCQQGVQGHQDEGGVFVGRAGEEEQEEVENPRQRIQQMISNRKERMKAAKWRRNRLKASKREELAHQIITDVLQTLDISILTICDNLLAVGLIFGPSIQSPKELIVFDMPFSCQNTKWRTCHSQENGNRPLDMVPLIRSFYRTIIMSEEFLELTSKSLTPTKTHICIFSRIELPEELRQNLIRLESTSFLSQLLSDQPSCPSDKFPNSVRPRRKRVKVLRMKCRRVISNMDKVEEVSCSTVEKVEDRDEFLLESNSFCCYQIPLRFKGVQCKNKG